MGLVVAADPRGRIRGQTGPPAVCGGTARNRGRRRGSVGQPPEFTALAHAPQLRAAVRASFNDVSRWRRHRVSRLEAGSNVDVVKQAVDDVAFDREVPVEALNGTLVVLPVEGVWWRRIAPGQILCSDTATSSPETFYQVVYEVVTSSLEQ